MGDTAAWKLFLARLPYFCFLGLGAFFCGMNFYLSFLRYRVYCLRGRQAEYRYASGAPFIGSLFVVGFLLARPTFVSPLPLWVIVALIVLAVLDTGGVHWFIGSQVWYYRKKAKAARGSAEASPTAGESVREEEPPESS